MFKEVATLLVMIVMPAASEQMKSTKMLDLKSPIHVQNMGIAFFHKILLIIPTHGDNNLFSGWTFHGHVDVGLWFVVSFDYFFECFWCFLLGEMGKFLLSSELPQYFH